MRHTGLLAIVLIALGIGCRAKEIPPPEYTGTSSVMAVPDSVVEVPMAFPLDALDGTVETRVPRLVGIRGSGWEYPRKPKCKYGIGLRSGFQPGPFDTSLDGHQLTLKTRMKYWARARRRTMADCYTHVEERCGTNEARNAYVNAVIRSELHWTPEWHLRADTSSRMTVENRCRLEQLDQDVNGEIKVLAERWLRENLEVIIRGFVPRETNARPRSETAWRSLQGPIDLGGGSWLVIDPRFVHGSQASSSGSTPSILMVARPHLVRGEQPATSEAPLPELGGATTAKGFHVAVEDELSFAGAGAALQQAMPQRYPSSGKPYLEVRDSRLSASGDHLVLELTVRGARKGKIYLAGRPVYEAASGRVSIPDLAYTAETQKIFSGKAKKFDHDGFVVAVRDAAVWTVAERVQAERGRLESALPRDLGGGAMLEGQIDAVDSLGVQLTPTGFHPVALLSGTLRLQLP